MKRYVSLLMVLLLVVSLGVTGVYASEGAEQNWYVTFTSDAKMKSNFKSATGINDLMRGMQPGDDMTFEVELRNQYPQAADWYMANEVRDSLEDSMNAASGGAYTYILQYVAPGGGTQELYNSSSVGGEGKRAELEGLHEATDALKDFFYLDTLNQGDVAKILLNVALDGESQGNSYQDTAARLQMNFAVELNDTTPTGSRWQPVRTGDESNILLWSGIMLGCGVAALLLGFYTLRRNRKNGEENRDE